MHNTKHTNLTINLSAASNIVPVSNTERPWKPQITTAGNEWQAPSLPAPLAQ